MDCVILFCLIFAIGFVGGIASGMVERAFKATLARWGSR